MITTLWIVLCASFGAEAQPLAQAVATAQAVARQETRDATLARWREALDLDLAREVLGEGLRATAPDGELAEVPAALALVAEAHISNGELAAAGELLARTPRARDLAGSPGASDADETDRAALEIARARLAIEEDQLDRALELLIVEPKDAKAPIVVRFPEVPAAYLHAARALVRNGDLARAAPLCKQFVEMAPRARDAPAAWHMLAQAALASRDLESARRCKESSEASAQWQAFYKTRRLQARAHPDDPLPRVGIAELWLAVDEHARATATALEIAARWPKFCRAYTLLATIERKRGEEASADERPRARSAAYAWLTRALECDPNLPEAHFDLGALALGDGDRARALPHMEWIVNSRFESDPRFLAAHLVVARLLRDRDPGAADRCLARYRALGGREDP